MYDTAIIGAGLSGLAAGIRLAYYGRRVCIFERHTTIGGLNSFYRLAGRNYDVGLHAVTNFAPPGTRSGPLARLLRQLRLKWDDFGLSPQIGSKIAFPGVSLEFNNDLARLTGEIAEKFPGQRDAFRKLLGQIANYDELETAAKRSAREVVGGILTDPLLIDMLFCPILFYGGACERDIDFGQFSILFRSIFCEGLARPLAGIRLILKNLVRKFKEVGGELKLRAGIARIHVTDGMVRELVLDNGSVVPARSVLSSAGLVETMRLCDDEKQAVPSRAGQLSFIESVSALITQPRDLGYKHTMVFFNDSERFRWEKPDGLADVHSGVICSPNNFVYDTPPEESMIRITALANFDRWNALGEEEYRAAKKHWYDAMIESAVRFIPDFRPAVIDTDVFTPKTIRRFTGHVNGAVYGSPEKRYDGRTHLKNLFLCGTDQGLVGIVGAIISGISIANRHLLREG